MTIVPEKELVARVQRLERCAWTSMAVAAVVWEQLTEVERLSFIEERIRTLAFLEATPAKSSPTKRAAPPGAAHGSA